MTREVFEAYVEGALRPSLRPRQVEVMDNFSSHKGSRIRELIEAKGCELTTFRPTRPISILPRRPSLSSRRCCAEPGSVPGRRP
jgi:hypothetical protein